MTRITYHLGQARKKLTRLEEELNQQTQKVFDHQN